jgi:fructoselysine-6-P-deglycase FrlB-like protein
MAYIIEEIASQPASWSRAEGLARSSAVAAALPAPGERVAVVGCGTSLYMAQCFAELREPAGGETDAFAASQFPRHRRYDRVVALTRSGTTTEVLRLLADLPDGQRSTVVTAVPDEAATRLADRSLVLEFADERSVVQTRFATTALALWRCAVGSGLGTAVDDARAVLGAAVDPALLDRRQFTFLGTGWTVGLAHEAALKLREAAQVWAESYPAMEYRHGPISVADEHSAVWILGPVPDGLREDVAATGAMVVHSPLDPMAQLVAVQRLAVAVAARKGLDPDRPRHLTRSVVLPATASRP